MVHVRPQTQLARRRAGLMWRAGVAGPALCLVLLVAACSDGDSTSGPQPSASGAAGSATGATGSPSPAATTKAATGRAVAPPLDTQTPSVAITTAPAVTVGTATTLSDGVRVLVSKVPTVKVEASGPGDIAGDGVAVHLTVKNSTSRAFDLDGLAVTATYGRAQPASPGGAGTGDLLTGRLKPGGKATGVYVFTVPKSRASSVQVQISSNASARIVVYKR